MPKKKKKKTTIIPPRGVQLELDPIQPTRPDRNRLTRDWSVSSGGWRWVAKPRNRVRRVGWRVLSSKTRLNRLDRSLNEIQRNKNFPASFWSEYIRFLWDLGRILGDVIESREILARSSGNLTGFSEISPDPVRSPPALAHFGLKSTILAEFFTVDGFNRTDRVSDEKSTASIWLFRRSVAGQNVLHPSPVDQSRVGHKLDPTRPVDTPNSTTTRL